MSQIYKQVTAGSLPPSVPTSFVTDDGTAIPAANILNVLGAYSSLNEPAGIFTTVDPDLSNNLYVVLSNRNYNTLTTTDATPTIIVNLLLPQDGVYTFNIQIAGYNTTDLLGASYQVFVGIIVNAGIATKIALEDKIVNEQVGMTACDVTASASGSSVVITVTGLAGKTIKWVALTEYTFVGA